MNWLRDNLYCVVGNAVKFSLPTGDGVTVTIEYDDSQNESESRQSESLRTVQFNPRLNLKVVVQDSGTSLSTDILEKFFNRPVQSNRTQMGGMGQGVYCLKQRVKALGDDCGVYTRLDNRNGTVVWFSLPFSATSTEKMNLKKRLSLKPSFHSIGLINTNRSRSSSHVGMIDITRDDDSINKQVKPSLVSFATTDMDNSSNPFLISSNSYQYGGVENSKKTVRYGTIQHDVSIRNSEFSAVLSMKTTVLDGLRILVVDDSVPILKMLVKVLKQEKAIVEDAKNGKEAVDKFILCRGNFDIVVTDIQVRSYYLFAYLVK